MDEIDILQETALAAQEQQMAERRQRMEAEARVKVPDHRDCSECGTPIPKKRLEAKPTAVLCVDCQTDAERVRH